MPTEDMTAISAKVRTDEKALFEQLCETEGVKPAVALHTLVTECIERGAISKVYRQQAINKGDSFERDSNSKTQGYMKMHGIKPMRWPL
jgi:hypothetical protein